VVFAKNSPGKKMEKLFDFIFHKLNNVTNVFVQNFVSIVRDFPSRAFLKQHLA